MLPTPIACYEPFKKDLGGLYVDRNVDGSYCVSVIQEGDCCAVQISATDFDLFVSQLVEAMPIEGGQKTQR